MKNLLDPLEALVAQAAPGWAGLYGGSLRLSAEPVAAMLSAPLMVEGRPLAWLAADPSPRQRKAARAALASWAQLLSAFLAERQISDGLTGELVIAWNRLTFLNSVIGLIRNTIDPLERSMRSLRLAAQALEVETAFLAFALPDGLQVFWTAASAWEGEAGRLVAAMGDEEDTLWCNDPDSVQKALRGIKGIHSFAGRKLDLGDPSLVYVGAINRAGGRFDAGDIQIFDSLIEMLISFAQSAALHERDLEMENLNRDLGIAAEIQANFLPSRLPRLENHEIAASVTPASMLGGDLCDVVSCGPDEVAVMVCDVAGKGVGAALLAAEMRAILRSEVRKSSHPDEVLQQVNSILLEDMERNERFATTVLMFFGPAGRPPRYASAGHTTGLLVHGATLAVERLTSSTVPLGILADLDKGCKSFDFTPGDVLLIYSDGLTETQNERGELLGLGGVTRELLSIQRAPAQMIVSGLLDAANRHRGSATLQDDLTLVVIKHLPTGYVPPIYTDHFTLVSDRSVLSEVETRLARLRLYLAPGDAMDKWLLQVQLAVTELVSNIIIHAYEGRSGEIKGLVSLYEDHFTIDLLDGGREFEARAVARPTLDIDNLPEGGFGMSIIHDVMDEVVYHRLADRHNYWTLGRRIAWAGVRHLRDEAS